MREAEPAPVRGTRLRPGTKKPELTDPGSTRYPRPENLGEGKASGWTVLIPRTRGAIAGPASTGAIGVPAAAEPDADQMITAIYGAQYRSLVRLAALLVGDVGPADMVVQDSFV